MESMSSSVEGDPHPLDHADQPAGEPAPAGRPQPSERAARTGRGPGATVLGAAMLAVGDILEPEKSTVEIVQTNDDPEPDLPFSLDFGDLPPLD